MFMAMMSSNGINIGAVTLSLTRYPLMADE
jgi:hypothetical protein